MSGGKFREADMEQGIYLDSLGCEHRTFPEPAGSVWSPEIHDGVQTIRLIRVEAVDGTPSGFYS